MSTPTLIPLPRHHSGHPPALPAGVELGCDGPVWAAVLPHLDLPEGGLPAEGYVLATSDAGTTILARDARGERHARATLAQLDGEPAFIVDWPQLERRGVIEGFYGTPWTHEQRLDLMALSERLKLNSYVYAPKDDPYHRLQWRDPYPAAELDRLAGLVRAAAEHGVDFVYALHPATSMRFSEEGEHAVLRAKAEQLLSIGIPTIALLFDDVPAELQHPADREFFGGSLGAAHGTACARFAAEVLRPNGMELLMVPMDYAGIGRSDYRDALAATLPEDALVWWTGSDVVVGEITRADIDAAAAAFGRRLLLWDNFPVNDFDRTRAFLGPLHGRTTDIAGSALAGLSVNPMVEYAPSGFGIASAADWAWNPGDYDESRSAAAALHSIAGLDAPALAPLVEALSSWPPSAPQYPRLAALLESGEADTVIAALAALRPPPGPLGDGLRPWIEAAAAWGAAASAALDLERGRGDVATVRARYDAASAHSATVAGDTIPPFVLAAIERA